MINLYSLLVTNKYSQQISTSNISRAFFLSDHRSNPFSSYVVNNPISTLIFFFLLMAFDLEYRLHISLHSFKRSWHSILGSFFPFVPYSDTLCGISAAQVKTKTTPLFPAFQIPQLLLGKTMIKGVRQIPWVHLQVLAQI